MTPRVSIVTTVYDRVECLARCIRSVQRSDYREIEHLIVSDNPPIDTLLEIERLASLAGLRHFNLPVRTNDWGRSPANVGLKFAHGEYVCFLSDDNAYLPDHFCPLVEALDTDRALGFVYSSCQYAGRKELRYAPPQGARIDLGQPLFRRAMLAEHFPNGIPDYGSFAWDWDLIHDLLLKGVQWQHVDRTTFIFRLSAYPNLVEALA